MLDFGKLAPFTMDAPAPVMREVSSDRRIYPLFANRLEVRRRRLGLAVAGGGVVADERPRQSWRDWIMEMATHMTYGGAAISTNRLNGGGTAPVNAGWGLNPGAATTAITDTALFDPAPEARVAGTFTQQTTAANVPNDTAQVVATITASSTRAITEFGLFDTATAAPQTTLGATISTTTGPT